MTVKYDKKTRRTFLQSSCGLALSIPFLPSLFSSEAYAAGASNQSRFIALTYAHGGVYSGSYFPPSVSEKTNFTNTTIHTGNSVLPSHIIREGDLNNFRSTIDGKVKLSKVISEKFNPLLGNMNILRGLDMPVYVGHHYGVSLGSIYNNINGSKDGETNMATIDQMLANSEKFYDIPPAFRSIHTGGSMSYSYLHPSNVKSQLQATARSPQNPADLFKMLFGLGVTYRSKQKVVDRALISYNRLKNHPRISASDKLKVDKIMNDYSELETRLSYFSSYNTDANLKAKAGNVTDYTDLPSLSNITHAERIKYSEDLARVYAVAIKTNATKVITSWMHVYLNNFSAVTDWHGHAHDFHNSQGELISHAKNYLDSMVYTLATELNEIEVDSTTYLDNSLIYLIPESSMTHSNHNNHILTVGGKNLGINVGKYFDYSNRENGEIIHTELDSAKNKLVNDNMNKRGLLLNSLWVTIMQSMGLAPADYEIVSRKGETKGWGDYYQLDKTRTTKNYDASYVYKTLPGYYKV